ncbi:zinc-ribbon and DUF3426 domain-containing protein [Psychrobacter sp. 1U1]|uniref:zinc-ribbon and DUF3426 domain-containing protein n=3 Tax=unclassified Psychrobacter TaxID=196806 RepID=UPI003F45E04F
MTTLIKTQCPSCQAYFSLPQTLLNELDAKVRCKRCQQIFLVNENLVVSGNEPSGINNTSTFNQKNNHNNVQQKDDDFLSSDTLIYDDMPIDYLESPNSAHNSLDEMSAWSFDLDATQISSTHQNSADAADKSIDTADSDAFIDHDIYNEQENMFEETNDAINTMSRYDNVSAPIDTSNRNTNNDNAWLEKLLEEQNHKTDVIEPGTDLSQLLVSMGVPLRDQFQATPKRASKAQSRIYPVQSRVQTSIASLLWLAGCLVLIMLLFAQYVIFNLDNLVKNPMYAERLQAVCAIAACSLPTADMTAFDIVDVIYRPSEVNAADGFTDIAATLANQSTKSQLLPNLKVSIYSNDDVIGEFIAMPKDYLVSKQNLLFAEQNKPFMFTVPVVNDEINKVIIDPIY